MSRLSTKQRRAQRRRHIAQRWSKWIYRQPICVRLEQAERECERRFSAGYFATDLRLCSPEVKAFWGIA